MEEKSEYHELMGRCEILYASFRAKDSRMPVWPIIKSAANQTLTSEYIRYFSGKNIDLGVSLPGIAQERIESNEGFLLNVTQLFGLNEWSEQARNLNPTGSEAKAIESYYLVFLMTYLQGAQKIDDISQRISCLKDGLMKAESIMDNVMRKVPWLMKSPVFQLYDTASKAISNECKRLSGQSQVRSMKAA